MIWSSIVRFGYYVGKDELSSAHGRHCITASSHDSLYSANDGGVAKRPNPCKDIMVMTVTMRICQYERCRSGHIACTLP